MYLYRIHIRPYGGTADTKTNFDYCLREGVLGVGWRVETDKKSLEWKEYEELALQTHGKVNACSYINRWIKPDDLVWTRDGNANYYLARVTSKWKYRYPKSAAKLGVDIANLFECTMKGVPIESVPGKVIACFRSPRVIQEVADERAREYSKYLWNTSSEEEHYSVDTEKFDDIFLMLDDEVTEDLVFLYLQTNGWHVVPNSRKGDTMAYEFYLVSPDKKRAATQVKTGGVTLHYDDYREIERSGYDKIYLFQAEGKYKGIKPHNVEVISQDDLRNFLLNERDWLPAVFSKKLEMLGLIARPKP